MEHYPNASWDKSLKKAHQQFQELLKQTSKCTKEQFTEFLVQNRNIILALLIQTLHLWDNEKKTKRRGPLLISLRSYVDVYISPFFPNLSISADDALSVLFEHLTTVLLNVSIDVGIYQSYGNREYVFSLSPKYGQEVKTLISDETIQRPKEDPDREIGESLCMFTTFLTGMCPYLEKRCALDKITEKILNEPLFPEDQRVQFIQRARQLIREIHEDDFQQQYIDLGIDIIRQKIEEANFPESVAIGLNKYIQHLEKHLHEKERGCFRSFEYVQQAIDVVSDDIDQLVLAYREYRQLAMNLDVNSDLFETQSFLQRAEISVDQWPEWIQTLRNISCQRNDRYIFNARKEKIVVKDEQTGEIIVIYLKKKSIWRKSLQTDVYLNLDNLGSQNEKVRDIIIQRLGDMLLALPDEDHTQHPISLAEKIANISGFLEDLSMMRFSSSLSEYSSNGSSVTSGSIFSISSGISTSSSIIPPYCQFWREAAQEIKVVVKETVPRGIQVQEGSPGAIQQTIKNETGSTVEKSIQKTRIQSERIEIMFKTGGLLTYTPAENFFDLSNNFHPNRITQVLMLIAKSGATSVEIGRTPVQHQGTVWAYARSLGLDVYLGDQSLINPLGDKTQQKRAQRILSSLEKTIGFFGTLPRTRAGYHPKEMQNKISISRVRLAHT